MYENENNQIIMQGHDHISLLLTPKEYNHTGTTTGSSP
jgi:hypothetical protein